MGWSLPDWNGGIALALFVASQWMIRLGSLVAIPVRRSPEAAKGWLLLFFIAPWPALIVYQFIGRPRHRRWRRERMARLPKILREIAGSAEREMSRCVAPLAGRYGQTTQLAKVLGGQDAVGGNRIELEPDYDRVIERLAADINAASDHVHLMFYIFADDGAGGRIMTALERAAGRGVKCRLIIDAIGSSASARSVKRRMDKAGVECVVALPIRLWGKVTRADLRNHRKIAVVDCAIGWTGSQNIVDADDGAPRPHRELMARLAGPAVAELQVIFLADWVLERGEDLDHGRLFPTRASVVGRAVAQVVASGPDRPSARIDLLFADMIAVAERRIVIVSPYFVPGEPLLFVLCAAAMRGIEVQLILSGVSDSRLVALAQEARYDELLENGVAVSLCQTHFVHAKHISIDDRLAMIGSSNMDLRSSELNAEVTLLIFDTDVVAAMRQVEADLLADSRHLPDRAWTERGRARKIASNAAKLFAPLL